MKQMTDSKKEKRTDGVYREIFSMMFYLIFVVAATLLIIRFVGQRTEVSGHSMEDTLDDGDNLIVDKLTYRFRDPVRYDIIVFPYKYKEDTYYIKRIIGAPLCHLQISHYQFQVDGVHVPDGISGSLHMDDVVVIKAPDYMDNGVGHADVAQEFVAQALSLAGSLHQTGDVHKFDDRWCGLLGVVHLGQLIQPVVRDSHHAHVGVDGAERIVGALGARRW